MERRYELARRYWPNASATLIMNEDGFVFVEGQYRAGYVTCLGPVTPLIARVDITLRHEAKTMRCNKFSNLALEEFCDEVFEEAKLLDHWFAY